MRHARSALGFAVTLVALLTVLPAAPAAADRTPCNPNVRIGNSACPNKGTCLRISGVCGWFGALNWMCIDKDEFTPNGKYDVGTCNNACVQSAGVCLTERCNDDTDCLDGLACIDGGCDVDDSPPPPPPEPEPEDPPPPPPPECVVDGDCCEREICYGGECIGVECRVDSHCAPDERCNDDYVCVARCQNSFFVVGLEPFEHCSACVADVPDDCESDPDVCSPWDTCGVSDFGGSYCIPACVDASPGDFEIDKIGEGGGFGAGTKVLRELPVRERVEPVIVGRLAIEWTGAELIAQQRSDDGGRPAWRLISRPGLEGGAVAGGISSRIEVAAADGERPVTVSYGGPDALEVTAGGGEPFPLSLDRLVAGPPADLSAALCEAVGLGCEENAPGGSGPSGRCGPDVTVAVQTSLRRLEDRFLSLSVFDAGRQCYGPGFVNPDYSPRLPALERLADSGTDDSCGGTVAIAGACFEASAVQSLVWGAANRLCRHDAVHALGWNRAWALASGDDEPATDRARLTAAGFDPRLVHDRERLARLLAERPGERLERRCRVAADGAGMTAAGWRVVWGPKLR